MANFVGDVRAESQIARQARQLLHLVARVRLLPDEAERRVVLYLSSGLTCGGFYS